MNWQTTVTNVFTGFMILKRCYDQFLDGLVRESGLTRIELEILLFLSCHPDLNTATDISANKLFTKSHVSTALKHLESIGYIRRYYDTDNHKTIYISLEPASFPLVHQGILLQKKFSEHILQGISEEEQEQMENTLDHIFANAKEALKKK